MPADLVAHCRERGIPMLAYTYNEPTVFFEYAYDTARRAHQHGLRNVFVSSGFELPAALAMIEPYLDAINVDLKAWSDTFYRQVCGTRLQPVLRNIEHIAKQTNIWIEITTLLIPGLNDDEGELREMAAWLAGVSPDLPWHISAFHPDYQLLDRPPTPHRTLVRAGRSARRPGCATSTWATCTTASASRRSAQAATRCWSAATGTACGSIGARRACAMAAGQRYQAFGREKMGEWLMVNG